MCVQVLGIAYLCMYVSHVINLFLVTCDTAILSTQLHYQCIEISVILSSDEEVYVCPHITSLICSLL